MIYRHLTPRLTVFLLAGLLSTAGSLHAFSLAEEISGHSPSPDVLPVRNPDNFEQVMGSLIDTGVLLIPESTNDRVMAFDPATGDLIDPDFIPADPANLSTPIQAILAADQNSILVSDQLEDLVQQYDLAGNYLGVFAPAGGVDTNILDNVRGIALDGNNNLLVTVGGGGNDDAIAQFDTSGNFLGNFVANGAGGLDSPFDVIPTAAGEFLVGGINSDNLMRYDGTGSYLADLSSIDTFPEQLYQMTNGNFLVGNFTGTEEGVVEYTSTGTLVGIYDPVSLGGYRGVYELANGNILTTNGSGVHEIDRTGNLVETKISGVSARFITFVQAGSPEPPAPVPGISFWGLMVLILLLMGLTLRFRHTA